MRMSVIFASLLAALVAATSAIGQATATFEAPVRLEADGAVIDTGKEIGHAGPMFVDHDGDGLPDLLVSSFGGTIRFFKNVGTRAAPVFEEKRRLAQADGKTIRIHNW